MRLTPNLSARDCWVTPLSSSERISRTSSSVSFALPLDSPKLLPVLVRPLACLSRQLSALLPSHKCFGLQQSLLSQVWQTANPSGIVPWDNSYAVRCDRFIRSPEVAACRGMATRPYPVVLSIPPVQSQQSPSGPCPEVLSTRFQNSEARSKSSVICLGLQQWEVEQLCRGLRPSGISPLAIMKATLVALTDLLFRLKLPDAPPFQGQQSSSPATATFAQNLWAVLSSIIGVVPTLFRCRAKDLTGSLGFFYIHLS